MSINQLVELATQEKENKKRSLQIYTHPHVDADNVIGTCAKLISLGLTPKEVEINFVPANTTHISGNGIAIDIAADKHPDGLSYTSSYFGKLLPRFVIDEVIEQDTMGRTSSRIGLSSIIAALRQVGLSDLEIIEHFFMIVEGWVKQAENHRLARLRTPLVQVLDIPPHTFLFRGSTPLDASMGRLELETTVKKSATGMIYYEENNMGIIRYPSHKNPDLSRLTLPGWFNHPDGFLFCWGSRKSPATVPPPITLAEFVHFLQENLQNTSN